MRKTRRVLTLALSVLLIASLCLGLAGCSGDKPNDPAAPTASAAPASAAPDTYVYAPQYIPVTGLKNGPGSITACGDGFYTMSYEVIGNETPEGVTPEWEGQYDIYGSVLYRIGLDGHAEKLDNYQPLQPEIPEDQPNASSSAYTVAFGAGQDGKLISIDSVYTSWYDGPDNVELYSQEWYSGGYYMYMNYEESYVLRTLDADGSELSRTDLTAVTQQIAEENGYFYPNTFAADKQGRVYLSTGEQLVILDADGSLLKTLKLEGVEYGWFENTITMPDGRVAALYYGKDGGQMTPIDPTTLELDTAQSRAVNSLYGLVPGGGEYDFCYSNGSNCMGYNFESGKSEKILNWINCDVNCNRMGNFAVLPDGRIATFETEWKDDYAGAPEVTLIVLSKVPASSVEKKKVLTLATMSLNWNMQDMLIKFNRSNPDYRIEVNDYSEYNTEDDYEAGLTKLNTEIMAGRLPDILDLNGLNGGQLDSRGLLVDLKPLIEADPELNGQIFDNILRALSAGGRVYRTASGFSVMTVLGAASIVGDTPGWTLDEYKAALATMPEGCDPFDQYTSRDSILYNCLSMEVGRLVDWDTGKCYFDTPLFTDLLKFAAEFPEKIDWDDDPYTPDNDAPNRIAAGRQMLMELWISDFDSYQFYKAIFGGDATFIGFPTSEGVGNALSFNDEGYAISAKCPDKEAAWQFVRTMFTEDFQSEQWYLPTNRAAFMKKLEAAMTPEYVKDEKGNYVLDENGEKIEVSHGSWGWGSFEVEMKSLTEEEGAELLKLVELTDRVQVYDYEMMQRIIAEAEAFFTGQKSAEDVGKLLQSKMTIYVNEQR